MCWIRGVRFACLGGCSVAVGLVALAVTLATGALCFGFGRKLRSFGGERAVTVFGCCCGSTGSGLLLLRILDPDLSTPIAKELAFFNIAILFIGFHVLTVMAPVLPSFSLMTICVVYAVTFVVCATLLTLMGRFFPLPFASDR